MAEFVSPVVNTVGWMKGLVGDLARRTEGVFGPGFVCEVNESHHYGHGMVIETEGKVSRWMNFNHTKKKPARADPSRRSVTKPTDWV
jgi:hypothetical protein